MLKLEASIPPKPSHDSRERCSAAEDYRYAREDCAAKYCTREGCTAKDYARIAPRKTAQERLHDGKLCERSQFGGEEQQRVVYKERAPPAVPHHSHHHPHHHPPILPIPSL